MQYQIHKQKEGVFKVLFDSNEVVTFVCDEENLESDIALYLRNKESPQELSEPYATKRQREYPPISEYIDGVVKDDQAQIDAYIAACKAIKAKYPKP